MSVNDDIQVDFTYIYGALGTAEPEEASTEWIETASLVAKMKFNCHTYDLKVDIDDPSKFSALLKNAGNLSSFMLGNLDTDRPRPQVYCGQGLSGLALKAAFIHIQTNKHDPRYQRLIDSTACLIFMYTPCVRAERDKTSRVLQTTMSIDQLRHKKKRAFKKFDATELTKMSSEFERQCDDMRMLSCYRSLRQSAPSGDMGWKKYFRRRKKPEKYISKPCFVMDIPKEDDLDVTSVPQVAQRSFTQLAAEKIGEFVGSIAVSTQHDLSIKYNAHRAPQKSTTLYSESNTGRTDPHVTTDTQPTSQSMHDHLPSAPEVDPLPDDSIPEPDYNIPYCALNSTGSHDVELIGRTEVLSDIDNCFLPNDAPKTLAETEEEGRLRKYCLHGTGGIGKSQVAIEYARSRKQHFDVIVMLNALTQESLMESYGKFAKGLGIVDDSAINTSGELDKTIVMNQVQSWLEKPIRNRSKPAGPFVRWLVIMDEVDKPEELFAQDHWFWPATGCGCLLITGKQSTIQTIAYFGQNGWELDLLPKGDAANMILQLTQKSKEHNASTNAEAIVEEWSCFPLTLLCISSVIVRKDWTLTHFLSLRDPERQVILRSDWSLMGKTYNLATAWAFSVLSEEEKTLLDLVSLLDSTDIQERIFTRHPEEAFALPYFPGNQGVKTFESVRSALKSTALLRRKTEYHYPSIYVHRTIRDTLFARLSETDRLGDTFCAAVGLVGSLFPATVIKDVNYSNLSSRERNECDALIPHVESLVEAYEGMKVPLRGSCATYKWARLLAEAAWFSYERSNMERSSALVQMGSEVVKLVPGDTDDLSVALWDTGSCVAASVGDTDTALTYIEDRIRVLETMMQKTGEPSARLCSAYSEKATTLLDRNELNEVMSLLDRSIAIRVRLPDFKREMLFNAVRGKGMYHMVKGEASKAEPFFQEILKDREDKYGVDDTINNRTGAVLGDIGSACYAQGDWTRGLAYFERAEKNFLVTLGSGHLSVARVNYPLSLYHIAKGNATTAIAHLDKSLEIYKKKPSYVAEKARVHFALSKAYTQLGNATEAAQHLATAAHLRSTLTQTNTPAPNSLNENDFDILCPLTARY